MTGPTTKHECDHACDSPQQLDSVLAHARRVVFNIKGNDYRLVTTVAYRFGAVYVKFIGTHAAYDRIDANTVEMM